MKLAALYSGGKDSTLAMYTAEQTGHTVNTIVNIIPKHEDSMIFHVPNMNMVPLLAEAMGKEIVTAFTDGSENDDMRALRDALTGLDVKGIVMGAVWSDYQWDRINSVCDDLGIICIAPLWRKDQDTVMNELIDSEISSIIVGVFADGLDDSWLGRNVCDSYEDLKKIRSKNRISIIGEGGEFETLTLDSPMQSSKLIPEEYEKEWNGRSGTLNVKRCSLVKKVR
ncbi:MAG: diphthine--ammonia ligase [Methanomassiliicoccaceae archaeon]|nr:diphthine--ammonia ligase [Methanomassiliicoccaceae archaeon]